MKKTRIILDKYLFSYLKKIIYMPIILIIYFIVLLLGLFFKILKIDILNLKYNDKKTYWLKKSFKKINMKNQY